MTTHTAPRPRLGVPAISVIFCVNRTNPHLRAAIESVLRQSHADFEFLIGANACSDEFFDELRSLAVDPRVRLFRTRLPQLAFTLNYLIEQASGDLLVRMDADDISEPHRFEQLLAIAAVSSADVIGSWTLLIDENDHVIGRFTPPTDARAIRHRMLWSSPLAHPAVAFRKSFWVESKGYLGGYVSEDFDLWLRAICRGATIINIPECLLRYRIHSSQVSRSRLGYAETAAHWYREFLIRPRLYTACGWLVASAKAVVLPLKHWLARKFK